MGAWDMEIPKDRKLSCEQFVVKHTWEKEAMIQTKQSEGKFLRRTSDYILGGEILEFCMEVK